MTIYNYQYKIIARLFFFLLLCSSTCISYGQNDSSSTTERDSTLHYVAGGKLKGEKSRVETGYYHDPGKAVLYATVFPGFGQLYNKKYWKLPLVYGALGAGIYAITFNHDQYRIYLDAFYTRVDNVSGNDQFVGVYDERQLIELQNIYRRWRDLSIILTGVTYGLQILDAYVDAHLFYFDVSDDLTINWQPSLIQNQSAYPSTIGVGLTINFK